VSEEAGPAPWVQRHWDWRATGNFVLGGAGAGLLFAATLALPEGTARSGAVVAGLAFVALGLVSVWFKIGRKLRALNVLVNPRTSWMAREAWVAPFVFAAGAWTLLRPGLVPALACAAAALLYAVCQARILQAAKGIPAWREAAIVPFLLATALVEGAAAALVVAHALASPGRPLYALFAVAILARVGAWVLYANRVAPKLLGEARTALDRVAPALLWFGSFGALALSLAAAALPPDFAWPLATVAALVALGTGWHAKSAIVTRISLNQGFAIPVAPVRGAR